MATVEFLKVALRREDGYPVGYPAPLYVVCKCGRKIKQFSDYQFHCDCGNEYNEDGWLLEK